MLIFKNFDDFVERPISALRFISLSLRFTVIKPRATRFARLGLGLFTKPLRWITITRALTFQVVFKSPPFAEKGEWGFRSSLE